MNGYGDTRPVVHAVRCTYPQCQATNGCVGACSKTAPSNLMQEFVQEAIHNEPFDCGSLTKDQWLQKFAELIVCECTSIIESQDVDPTFKNRMSWAIKERFGVIS